jgi:hypothetical protein
MNKMGNILGLGIVVAKIDKRKATAEKEKRKERR